MLSASGGLRPSDPLTGAVVLPRSLCSLNIPNLCDKFVKKVVSEIRKCRQLQRYEVPLTSSSGQGQGLWTSFGALPPNPRYVIWPTPS